MNDQTKTSEHTVTVACKVAVVDDDDGLLDALTELLTNVGWSVDSYSSAEGFLASFNGASGGCALIDVRLPGMDGMELFRKLHEDAPGFPVVILTGHGDVQMAVEALKAGAVDFIQKPFDPDHLINSLRQAMDLDATMRERRAALEEFHVLFDKLTGREREVMNLMVLGQSSKKIAAQLGISSRTVEIYRMRVMEKMQAASLAELVRLTLGVKGIKGEISP